MSITCEDAKLMVSMLAEGNLADNDAATLNKHLQGCPRCMAYQRDIQQIQAKLTTSLPDNTDYTDIADRVMASLPVKTRSPRPTLRLAWLLAPGLCALALALIFASSVLHKPNTQQSAKTDTAPVVPAKKLPEPDKPAVKLIAKTPPASASVLTKSQARPRKQAPKHKQPAPKPKDKPKEPTPEKPDQTPSEPPIIASAPVEPQMPTPGRIHLEVPDSDVVVTSADYYPESQATSAYVCMDVAAPDGIKSVPLYRMPARAPRRPISLASIPPQKELF